MSNVNASARTTICIVNDLNASLEKLKSYSFYKQFVEDMQRPEFVAQIQRVTGSCRDDGYPYCSELVQLVLYGVGSIACSEASRLQLCLAFLLKENCEWIDDVVVYDPILTPNETKAIQSFFMARFSYVDLTIPSENENGRRRVARPTLFFMPYCPYALINNVLEANWRVDNLNKIIILGNSFTHHKLVHACTWDKKDPKDRHNKHMLGIQKNSYTVEMPIPETCPETCWDLPHCPFDLIPIDGSDNVWMKAAFSNISWHFFVFADASTDLNRLLS